MADVPDPWATALVEAGLVNQRSRESRPSLRQLAERTGLSVTTLSEMINGTRRTRQENIDRVADALSVDPRIVAQWVHTARSVSAPYEPPAEANLLDHDERDAVSRIIRLMARGKRDDAQKILMAVDGNNRPRGSGTGSTATVSEGDAEGDRDVTLEDSETTDRSSENEYRRRPATTSGSKRSRPSQGKQGNGRSTPGRRK